jgi:hypothetical protein
MARFKFTIFSLLLSIAPSFAPVACRAQVTYNSVGIPQGCLLTRDIALVNALGA